MSNAFRWCFIGTGKLAETVAKEILPSGRHQITAVYTRRIEKGRAFSEKFGGKAYGSAEEAIIADDVDGIYVVTPHNSHYEYVKQALMLGKPVLCEKSFTVDAGQTRELIELARSKEIYLAEAMWTWFNPVSHQVKRWINDGEFGTIRKVTANYHMNSKNYSPRVTDPEMAGGALLDVGVYPITYLYRLFGKPVSIKCTGILSGGIDLKEDVAMTFEDGNTYIASASITDYKGLEHLAVSGDKAKLSIWWFHFARKAVLKRKSGRRETFTGKGGYLNEFDCVAGEIREGLKESRLVPLRCTLDVMEIMDECRRQMGLVYPFEVEGKKN